MPLGYTRSGKEIEFYNTQDETELELKMKSFDDHDRFDVYAVYEFLTIKWRRHDGELSSSEQQAEIIATFCLTKMTAEFRAQEKKLLNLATSIDIVRFGKSLVQQSLHE
jgi:hypothetical protein